MRLFFERRVTQRIRMMNRGGGGYERVSGGWGLRVILVLDTMALAFNNFGRRTAIARWYFLSFRWPPDDIMRVKTS